jgi:hypothetical protein
VCRISIPRLEFNSPAAGPGLQENHRVARVLLFMISEAQFVSVGGPEISRPAQVLEFRRATVPGDETGEKFFSPVNDEPGNWHLKKGSAWRLTLKLGLSGAFL